MLEHSHGQFFLMVVPTELLQLVFSFGNPLPEEALLVYILALIYHKCILIPLNHLLDPFTVWPGLYLRIKRTANYSTRWNPTKNGEFIHLFL
ncbi:hypothetical protein SESBI_19413 [Sesbania bispinosa]|nr:hypothetical protein SESBI_19413 [Sesbania bispinosa]